LDNENGRLLRVALAPLLIVAAVSAMIFSDQFNLTALNVWLGSFGVCAPVGYVTLLPG